MRPATELAVDNKGKGTKERQLLALKSIPVTRQQVRARRLRSRAPWNAPFLVALSGELLSIGT